MTAVQATQTTTDTLKHKQWKKKKPTSMTSDSLHLCIL